jgi:protoheme IX farnesyltransferase
MLARVKTYYWLTKPGIIYGNSLSVIAGFLFASQGAIHLYTFIATLIGIGLVMACGCVLNNIIDRGIDQKMARTKKRALVTGEISSFHAYIFASILGLVGFGTLLLWVNWLSAGLGFIALFSYVVLYGIAKRKTIYGTLVGSIPGAIPPVVGYVAATNQIDIPALLLFVILVTWQMPHFYSIAIYRAKEYKAAGIPVWPLKKGVQSTKLQILLFISLFIVASLSLTFFGYAGLSYALILSFFGSLWLTRALKGFNAKNNEQWARGMFGFSLFVLLSLCAMLAVDAWLP